MNFMNDEVTTEKYNEWTLTRTDPYGHVTVKPNKPGFGSGRELGVFTSFKQAREAIDTVEAEKKLKKQKDA